MVMSQETRHSHIKSMLFWRGGDCKGNPLMLCHSAPAAPMLTHTKCPCSRTLYHSGPRCHPHTNACEHLCVCAWQPSTYADSGAYPPVKWWQDKRLQYGKDLCVNGPQPAPAVQKQTPDTRITSILGMCTQYQFYYLRPDTSVVRASPQIGKVLQGVQTQDWSTFFHSITLWYIYKITLLVPVAYTALHWPYCDHCNHYAAECDHGTAHCNHYTFSVIATPFTAITMPVTVITTTRCNHCAAALWSLLITVISTRLLWSLLCHSPGFEVRSKKL